MSSVRINGKINQPKVLDLGSYAIEIDEGNTPKKLFNISVKTKNRAKLKVEI